tara:strand:+ start:1743 stop:1934 length:192 start_codon:yes stop_codon:yes gene_type:complete
MITKFKTELSEEWYILMPNKAAAKLTNDGVGVSYNSDKNTIETFQTLEDYEARCIELNIILDE